jgi:hypothetical protein
LASTQKSSKTETACFSMSRRIASISSIRLQTCYVRFIALRSASN